MGVCVYSPRPDPKYLKGQGVYRPPHKAPVRDLLWGTVCWAPGAAARPCLPCRASSLRGLWDPSLCLSFSRPPASLSDLRLQPCRTDTLVPSQQSHHLWALQLWLIAWGLASLLFAHLSSALAVLLVLPVHRAPDGLLCGPCPQACPACTFEALMLTGSFVASPSPGGSPAPPAWLAVLCWLQAAPSSAGASRPCGLLLTGHRCQRFSPKFLPQTCSLSYERLVYVYLFVCTSSSLGSASASGLASQPRICL